MLPSEVPGLTTDSPVRVFPGVWKLLSFLNLPSWDGSLALPLLFLFLSFVFFPTSFRRQWSAFLGAWCPLPAFRSCFVEFSQCSNVLFINLWGRKWSPHLFFHHLRTAPSSFCFSWHWIFWRVQTSCPTEHFNSSNMWLCSCQNFPPKVYHRWFCVLPTT